MRLMTQRKNYEAPAMEVVELKLQGSLLAGSGTETYDNSEFGEGASLDSFDSNWE